MQIRLLVASTDPECHTLVQSMLNEALCLIPQDVTTYVVHSRQELEERLTLKQDDIVFLDWSIAGPETPALVRTLLERYPHLRIVALLPLHLRQYRQAVWEAGACNGMPREHMDQEWLSSMLCVMQRSMEREAQLARLTEQLSGARSPGSQPSESQLSDSQFSDQLSNQLSDHGEHYG